MELPFYDERSDETTVQEPESSLDRMMWSSTTNSSISEDEPTQM
jgi:hypothetical protein